MCRDILKMVLYIFSSNNALFLKAMFLKLLNSMIPLLNVKNVPL